VRPAAEAFRRLRAFATAAALTATVSGGLLAQTGAAPSYHVVRSIPLGGSGRWDYITLDSVKHRLFIARQTRVMVVNPESGKLLGEIPGLDGAHGVALDHTTGHGFATSGRDGSVTTFDLGTLPPMPCSTTPPPGASSPSMAVPSPRAASIRSRARRWATFRSAATGRSLGVLDVSGFRDWAHPHTLNLALALALAIEQSVGAREVERRYLVVTRLTHLSQRYPADGVVAVDRRGRILLASPAAPTELSPGREDPALRALVPELVGRTRDSLPQEVALAGGAGGGARRGVWHPVLEGRTVVGGCLVLEHQETGARPRARKAPGRLGSPRHTFADIVGESPACRSARQAALAAAGTDLPVLLLGEPGTGAELFAQAIHQAGSRRDRPFLAVNCAALPR
jgi:hypothetical protein